MRYFHSYGPVDSEEHFSVPRQGLVDRCTSQLIGNSDKGGHYFTIWAPRQTGKTWLIRQATQKITDAYPEEMTVFHFSLGTLRGMQFTSGEIATDFPERLHRLLETTLPNQPDVNDWAGFANLFSRENGLWDRPLILLIDEVDTIPSALLDLMVGQFRELYLQRDTNWLHGLALVGVRAVLGVDSKRGSPFNVQRSLHVTNFTQAEVQDLYGQYEAESGQAVAPEVIETVYHETNGQPGLVNWFGELLTEKYNLEPDQAIDIRCWNRVSNAARFLEPNNTVLNLIAKGRRPEYNPFLLELFTQSDMPFRFHKTLHSDLYMHGLIIPETTLQPDEIYQNICRFSSPFVQDVLHSALTSDLVGDRMPLLPLDPLDDLADVFAPANALDLAALLPRYKDYLLRLKAAGINPWQEQPRRKSDRQLTEAVGHFHLYAWLKTALRKGCVVSPEFPTGNGRVDLHIRCNNKEGVIEVKSFVSQFQAVADRKQAARYGKKIGLDQVTLALFIPVEDEKVLNALSVTDTIDGVTVNVVAIGWT